MYFAFAVIYIVLCVVFIADVLASRRPRCPGVGKALWILALLVVPVFAWVVYGFWRMRQSRGL